jgi:small subunit ribosomal protein S24e
MDMETVAKRDNPLMKRVELEFVIHHPGEETPQRDSVRALAADQVGGEKASTVIDHLDTEFGQAATKGYAKVYESEDAALEAEPDHILERNQLAAPEEGS